MLYQGASHNMKITLGVLHNTGITLGRAGRPAGGVLADRTDDNQAPPAKECIIVRLCHRYN